MDVTSVHSGALRRSHEAAKDGEHSSENVGFALRCLMHLFLLSRLANAQSEFSHLLYIARCTLILELWGSPDSRHLPLSQMHAAFAGRQAERVARLVLTCHVMPSVHAAEWSGFF